MTEEFPVGLVATIVAVAAVVVGGSIYFGLPLLRPATQDLACGGLTVNSISPSGVVSSDTDISKLNFIVDTTITGGECISGTLSTSLFSQKTGLQSTVPLQISITSSKERIRYPITPDFQLTGQTPRIITAVPAVARTDGGKIQLGQWCGSSEVGLGAFDWTSLEFQRYDAFGAGDHKLVCARPLSIGSFGQVGSWSIEETAVIQLNAGDSVSTQTIDSMKAANVEFRDQRDNLLATATWTGNEVTGVEPPEGANYRGLWFSNAAAPYGVTLLNTWLVVPKDAVTNSVGEFNRKLGVLQGLNQFTLSGVPISGRIPGVDLYVFWQTYLLSAVRWIGTMEGDSPQQYLDYISTANSETRALLTAEQAMRNSKGVAPSSQFVSGTLDLGQITMEAPVKYENARVRFLVAATTLGVKIPVGKPEIVGVKTTEFASVPGAAGGLGTATIEVKNVGDGQGTFAASVACTTFQQYSPAAPLPLAAGQTINIPVQMLRGQSTQAITDTCTATVYEFSKSSLRSERQFSWASAALSTCGADGYEWGVANAIYVCQNGQPVLKATCNAGTAFDGTRWICSSASTGGAGGVPPSGPVPTAEAPGFQKCLKGDFKCDWTQLFGIWWFWLLVALAVVAALVAISRSRGY